MRAQAGLQGCHLSLGVTPLRRAGGTFPLRPSPPSSALLPATEPQCRQRPDREPRRAPRVLARPCGCGRCSPPVPCIAPRPGGAGGDAAIPWRCVPLLGRAPQARSPAQLLLSRNHFAFSTSGRSQRCSGSCSQLGSVGQADKPIGLASATRLSRFRAPGVSYRQGVWLRNKCFSRKPTLPLRSEQSEHSLPFPGRS